MKRNISLILLLLLGLSLAGGLGCAGAKGPKQAGPVTVAATLLPLGDFAKQVGQEKIKVTILAPASTPTELKDVPLLVSFGGGFDAWSADLVQKSGERELVVIRAQAPGQADTAYPWLDPIEAQKIVQDISRALAQIDPAQAELYKKNAMHFIVEMANLDWEIKQTLAKLDQKKLPALPPAWADFAKRYGFKTSDAASLELDAFGKMNDPRRGEYLELMRWNLEQIVKAVPAKTKNK